jgi:hypothetical protein
VKQYYVVMRSLLRSRSDLRRCLSRCRHCRIFFLSHPRNAKRSDLRCPFGCRQAHRRQQSTERSAAYYASEEGKAKKKIQNDKRATGEARADGKDAAAGGRLDFNAGIVSYIAMAASLIEGRRVSEEEIVEMLVRRMRQHSIVRRRKIDYVVAHLKKNGP